MMIDLVWGADRPKFPGLFNKIFKLRHQIFKERLGWDVNSIDGLEIDAFDNCNPAWFVSLDDAGEVNACWRVLPTTGPNMLADTFSSLLGGEPAPKSSTIWEASRFAVSAQILEDHNLACLNKITAELLCALLEFGTANGIDEVVTVCDVTVARLMQRMGFAPTWKTRPQRLGNTVTIAAGYEISPAELARARTHFQFTSAVLRHVSTQAVKEVA